MLAYSQNMQFQKVIKKSERKKNNWRAAKHTSAQTLSHSHEHACIHNMNIRTQANQRATDKCEAYGLSRCPRRTRRTIIATPPQPNSTYSKSNPSSRWSGNRAYQAFRLRCDAMMLMVKKRRRQADKKWKWKKNWMKLSFGIFRGKHFARTQECHSRMRVRHHSPKHVESTNCFSDSNVQHSTTYLCSTSVGRLRWRTIGRCFDIYPSQTPQSQCQTHKWIAFICRIYFLGCSLTVVGVVEQLLRFKENIHWKMTTYEKITHQQRWAHTYIVRDVLRKY